ncbi:MAG: DUF4838 domain-containing protein [Verrucomicrobia bacterium]|nr:DUF4838 domain-containing protein [Verrucomicrobiota bacterium]
MIRLRVVLVAVGCALAVAVLAWSRGVSVAHGGAAGGVVVFSPAVSGCAIVVPARASEAEWRAAALISETLAAAAGRETFPVVRETGSWARRGIFVGETLRARDAIVQVGGQPPFDDVFTNHVADAAVVLRSARPGAIEIAAAWWLEQTVGAHWFMPGPLGTHVPRRDELHLAAGEARVRPGFLSRSLGGDAAWGTRNKLEARLAHGHSYAEIFKRADLVANPALAPMRAGTRFIPPADGMQGWQPDLTAPAAVLHAAGHLNRAFDREPKQESLALCQNDSVRFDDSPDTLARVSPLRWFRRQPDYTPLVFRFTNEVADLVRVRHPGKWIGAYAYDWTENAPGFRLAPNVVPWLTADRSQWFEPEFVAEDKATMAGWVNSGARIVGTYDYFEGTPYLVPRPTLYAVAAIPEIHAAGVRAFYGEGAPNWGLDGPKLWLAAQSQWDPRRPVKELLDVYYREFWQEAAEPMRAYFDCAERAWLTQPKPGYWIKYYKDEHQVVLFPVAVRREMERRLAEAARLARGELVRRRLAFVRDAFSVTTAFAEYAEARDRVAAGVMRAFTEERALSAAVVELKAKTEAFRLRVESNNQKALPPVHVSELEYYRRSDPTGAVVRRLSQSESGRRLLMAERMTAIGAPGPELLRDGQWTDVAIGDTSGPAMFEWAGSPAAGAWRGHGDPYETRRITWGSQVGGGRALRFAGCKQETLSQWRDGVVPGATYVASVRVRGQVSPGNSTFLIMTFFDEKFQPFELGHTFRLPAGDWREWSEIAVVKPAPAKARYVGIGVRVLNQVNDDFAEFSGISLRLAGEAKP